MSKRRKAFHRRRAPGAHGAPGHQRIPLTPEGFPAAAPDAPPVSPVVFVSDESRKSFPWLPGRVIAWSVWHGPDHVRVQIDESGHAVEHGGRQVLARVA
jgi:hypothetical protein